MRLRFDGREVEARLVHDPEFPKRQADHVEIEGTVYSELELSRHTVELLEADDDERRRIFDAEDPLVGISQGAATHKALAAWLEASGLRGMWGERGPSELAHEFRRCRGRATLWGKTAPLYSEHGFTDVNDGERIEPATRDTGRLVTVELEPERAAALSLAFVIYTENGWLPLPQTLGRLPVPRAYLASRLIFAVGLGQPFIDSFVLEASARAF